MDDIALVQSAPAGLEREVPLVLIHDGGGTVVSYFYLGSLDRTVYAIQNPRFYTGQPWDDGLPEMAREYTESIKSEIPSGPILIGGWSLGGILSLEIASILSRSSDIQVLGIVMIDSVFPCPMKWDAPNVVKSEPIFDARTNDEMRARVSRSMDQAHSMVKDWQPPVWKGCKDPEAYQRRIQVEEAMAANLSASDDTKLAQAAGTTTAGMSELPPAPHAVLLRCNEYVPVTDADRPDVIARVDVARDLERLGWETYAYDFITAVLEIPGHHFNIFTEDYLDDVTTRIKLACRMLERVNL